MKDVLEILNAIEMLHTHILNTWDEMQIPHLNLQQFVEAEEFLSIFGQRLHQVEGNDGLDLFDDVLDIARERNHKHEHVDYDLEGQQG